MNELKLTAKIGAGVTALLVPIVLFYEGTITHSYKDPIGIVTACTGHTGVDIHIGQTFTKSQCDDMLYADLLKHADDIDCIDEQLTDGQKAAFISFGFNVGKNKFCKSTLVRKANAGDMAGACKELLRWTLAAGKELPGLVKRRQAEYKLCMGEK